MRQRLLFFLTVVSVSGVVAAQSLEIQGHTPGASSELVRSVTSPLHHLMSAPSITSMAPPFQCRIQMYYDPYGSDATYSENLPTSYWAARVSMPSVAAAPCTVWTVHIDFELTNSSSTQHDTIQFVIRERNYPYAQLFTTYFLARAGDNTGEYEIDPPPVPPYNVRSIIDYPLRDMYIGYYVRGDPQHAVNFRFKTPSLWSSPPVRSVRFSSPTAWEDVSTTLGYSADLVIYSRICCQFPIPVELSTFNAVVESGSAHLRWRTASETNNAQFEIQRAPSSEGPWESRGAVPGHGTTTAEQEYEYRDPLPDWMFTGNEAGIIYYRLVQTDFDGSQRESPVVRVQSEIPGSLRLSIDPVYPNPLALENGIPAMIRYTLPVDQPVHIAVFDALGQQVATLVELVQTAGTHEVRWNPQVGALLHSGTYFIRMQTPSQTRVRTISLVR